MGETIARVVRLEQCQDEHCKLARAVPSHLLVVHHYQKLQHNAATAISYTWGAFNRIERSIGHYKDGSEVFMELGDEWDVTDLVTTLHGLCHQDTTGSSQSITDCCWIDQLCIFQDDTEEVRQTLAKIPEIYRTLDVVILLPGPRCTCVEKRLQAAIDVGPQDVSTYRHCPNDEFLNANSARVAWTSVEVASCPVWWDSQHSQIRSNDKEDHETASQRKRLTPLDVERLSPVTRLWLSSRSSEMKLDCDDVDASEQTYVIVSGQPSDAHMRFDEERLGVDSTKALLTLTAVLQLWQQYNTSSSSLQRLRQSSAMRLLLGERFAVPEEARKPHNWLNDMTRFTTSLFDLAQSTRVATQAKDYVLAVFTDCPNYVIPHNFRSLSHKALLEDAVTQLRSKAFLKLATFAPSGVFGSLDSSSLDWRPASYMDDDTRIEHAGDVFGPLLPAFEDFGIPEFSGSRFRRAKIDCIGALEAVEKPNTDQACSHLLDTLQKATLSWEYTPSMILKAHSAFEKALHGRCSTATEMLFHVIQADISHKLSYAGMFQKLSNSGPDSNIDVHAIVLRIIGESLGLAEGIVKGRSLHVMIRRETEYCPPLFGLSWRDVDQRDPEEETYPIQKHYCRSPESCSGDDQCEESMGISVMFEVAEVITPSGGRERQVIGTYGPTKGVPLQSGSICFNE